MESNIGNFLYESNFPIRWGDMDAMGHVNNIMYFRYFEQVRLEGYEAQGCSVLLRGEGGMLIVDNHAEYLKPMTYPMNIKARMYGSSPGRSSFISTYLLTVNDELYTRGSAKVVWIDPVKQKSIPLPGSIRALLTSE